MAGRQIKTPTNQKLLTNVAVVRMKRAGKRFEIACYPNKVSAWRNKVEKNLDEVLQTPAVFTNVSKGQLAKRDDLMAAFEIEDHVEVCKMILEKGELQVTEKERANAQEATFKEVATIIANMCVDPNTKRPFSTSMIEKALKEIHFSVKPKSSGKQQALEMIPKLRESFPIERAKMRVRVWVPSHSAQKCKEKVVALFAESESETFEKGDLELVGLIEPGNFRQLDETVKKESKGKGRLELLELRNVAETEEIM